MHKVFVIMALALTACTPSVQDGQTPLSRGASLSVSCSGCHTETSDSQAIPSFSGWSEEALAESLKAYKSGQGDSVMHRYARGLSSDDIAQISRYLGVNP